MSKDKKENIKVAIAYICVCIVWGSTFLAMRIGAKAFPPELFAGIRFLLAGLIVLVFAMIKKYEFPKSFNDCVRASIPGILMLMISNGLVMWAAQWVESGITSILVSTAPLFVTLLEHILFRQDRKSITEWICIILGFFGTVMVIVSGSGIGSIDIFGGVLILSASVFWALGSIYSKKVKYSGHIASHIGLQMLVSGIGLTVFGFVIGEGSKVQINNNAVLAMAYLVIFGSAIAYSANIYVLSKWPASIASTSSYINPIVAVILGALILNEMINLKMIIFMIITIGSVVALHLKKNLIQQSKKLKGINA